MVATAKVRDEMGQNVKFLNHLETFFTIASPTQHIAFIEYWMEMVVTDQFYARNNAPSDLLHRHKIYVELFECAFECIAENALESGSIAQHADINAILKRERDNGSYFPVQLNTEELIDPGLVLKALTEFGDLAQFKYWLSEWLIDGLTGNIDSEAKAVIFPLYRILKKLVEACWLMCSREICETENTHTHAHELQPLLSFVTTIIPTEYIFCLSYKNGYVDLMVVVDKDCHRSFIEMEPLLEFAALGFPKISCTLHSLATLNDLLLGGRLYYLRVCRAENCLFQKANAFPLPVFDKSLLIAAEKMALPIFEEGIARALVFYKGASNYLRLGELNVAVFMLQQVCELAYRSLLHVLRGKEIKTHDLTVLRKHLHRYYPVIIGQFSDDEQEELRLLEILESAYIGARYNDAFFVSEQDVTTLHEKIWLLLEEMKLVFEKRE